MSKKSVNTNEQDKPKTKYDRKVEARRKAAAKEKRNSIILRTICILFLIAIIGTVGYFSVTKILEIRSANNDPYMSIGDHTLTKVAYDYYFNTTVNNYINNYAYFLSYMGLDTSLPYDEQQYSEDMTWQEYFEQMTIEQLREEYALLDDAQAQGFEYDTIEDYDSFVTSAKEIAQENQMTMGAYYKAMFGEYATANNVKQYIENTFITSAYYEKLLEDNTPDEGTITDYYEEHKDNYDLAAYYSFSFHPSNYEEDTDSIGTTDDTDNTDSDNVESDDTEGNTQENTDDNADEAETDNGDNDIETNNDTEIDNDVEEENSDEENEDTTSEETNTLGSDTAYILAQEMKKRLENGEDFEALCLEYAQEDSKANYEAEDGSEYSLTSNVTFNTISADYSEWLSDESRKEGDITVIQVESGICYVLKFVSRTYNENCRESISDSLASEATEEYLQSLLENKYEAKDIKGEISYLREDDAEETDSSNSESLLNTDIIE